MNEITRSELMEIVFEPISSEESDRKCAATSSAAIELAQVVPSTLSTSTARLHGFGLNEQAIISLAHAPGELIYAETTTPLASEHVGRRVLVVFDNGSVHLPIIIGVIQTEKAVSMQQATEVNAGKDRIEISAKREIVLECGDASITLTRAGKILIKGKYVLSCSSGHNRIKGAIVDIN